MSESEYYWPSEDQPGKYTLERRAGDEKDWEWDGAKWRRGIWFRDTSQMIEWGGYLGVRREPAGPITEDDEDDARGEREILEAAQQALAAWRSIQHKPAEVERWAYRWAVELCERLGAR